MTISLNDISVEAPSLSPNEPFDLLMAPEAVAATIDAIQRLASAEREGDRDVLEHAAPWFEGIVGLRQTVHQVAIGRTYAEAQAGRGRKRRAHKIGARNTLIADEFLQRQAAYIRRGEHISFSNLAEQVGRHPRFNLKRSAAIRAVKAGLPVQCARQNTSAA